MSTPVGKNGFADYCKDKLKIKSNQIDCTLNTYDVSVQEIES